MDDKVVIETLAKFMGYEGKIVQNSRKTDWFLQTPSQDGDSEWTSLDFLTSYNAIAEVWRRVVDSSDVGALADRARRNLDMRHDYWYRKEPRDHAHALAKAILEAKKQDEPGDFKGENY